MKYIISFTTGYVVGGLLVGYTLAKIFEERCAILEERCVISGNL